MRPLVTHSRVIDSPMGTLTLGGCGTVLRHLYMSNQAHVPAESAHWPRDDCSFEDATSWLADYFGGSQQRAEMDITMEGSAFQSDVWAALREIPYGDTWSYGKLAAHLGVPRAARAVGAAVARNPIAIIVPCHRVVGADGSLTGFAGGLERKRTLLELEQG